MFLFVMMFLIVVSLTLTLTLTLTLKKREIATFWTKRIIVTIGKRDNVTISEPFL